MNTIGIEKHGSKIAELFWGLAFIAKFLRLKIILASILAVISSAIFDWCNSTCQKETKVAFNETHMMMMMT